MKSSEYFDRARTLLPGGVSSPVRAIKPYPFYTARAEGCRLTTVDDEELIDCCMAYGPLLLGHAHPEIKKTIEEQLSRGWLYGTPTPLEPEFAGLVTRDHPGMDMVRFVSSGSEATMAAIRLARGFSGKKDLVKLEGGFHGAHDGVLIKAGSGATTLGVPDSAGVIPEVAARTRQVAYNDSEALEELLSKNRDIAALIMEPVMGNIGPILPRPGYLADVREITRTHDVLLIFDEVITGYRLGIGGAQAMFGVEPDLTTLGKILGGGLPIGAFGGRKEIMSLIAPEGPVYQAGTFSGNPLSLAAGYGTLDWIHRNRGVYGVLEDRARRIGEAAEGKKGSFVRIGSMFKHFFRDSPPENYLQAKECDTGTFLRFWSAMRERGIFLPPSQFETNFLSIAHGDAETALIGEAYGACLS
ncbi:glutamate-1-semialdehyde 2,1-aminomutase [Methanolinea mesophila]|uniref:glutamate-1-semialdehyde 2,1-aminomutase n=1 Tax=Methanolinea mesophila TaxID=547055 RepID=UPI001AE280D8|nr:glutamate-1-semialdehyde 2,1-aminomutase [Methanolinea mesophila]MBP1929613.1 glutamate-1-semialdehyde 2,1-aminomutase [Methanolinea mesophila]